MFFLIKQLGLVAEPRKQRFAFLGVILALLTALAGIGLLSLSGWFISAAGFAGLAVGTAGVFNYFLPATGVRFFALTRIAGRYGERIVTHDYTFQFLARLRVWFYEKLEPLAPAYLSQYRSGDLLNRFVQDIDALDHVYLRVWVPCVVAFIVMLLISLYLTLFSVRIGIAAFGFFVLTALLPPLLMYFLGERPGVQLTEEVRECRKQAVSYVQNLTELFMFGAQKAAGKALDATSGRWLNAQQRMSHYSAFSQALVLVLLGLAVYVLLTMSAHVFSVHHLSGANIALIVLTVIAVFEILAPIPFAFQYWGKTRSSLQRLKEVCVAEPCVGFPSVMAGKLESYDLHFNNVTFAYRKSLPILRDFSLEIPQGKHIALIGPTGSGKTTLLSLLQRFWDPTMGTVNLGGSSIAALDEATLRRCFSIVDQKPYLFNTTLRENLVLGNPHATEPQIWEALSIAALTDVVEAMPEGLETWMGELGARLSGGQLRRLAIARAVLFDAPILLLDEPMVGLDEALAQRVMSNLRAYCKNRTMIVVTHRVDAIKPFVECCVTMPSVS